MSFSIIFKMYFPLLHYLLFPIFPISFPYLLHPPALPTAMALWTFLACMVAPGYVVSSEDLELEGSDKGEQVVLGFLGLGYFTQHNLS